MTTRARTLKTDENEVLQKSKQVVQVGKTTATNNALVPKRAALGELGNRALARSKDGQKENFSMKNVKARVDTHWKKTEVRNAAKEIEERAKKWDELSKATESSKVRLVKLKTTSSATTSATSSSSASIQQIVPIRREESNVTRRQLSKVKAVFCKDKKEKVATVVAAPTTKNIQVGIVGSTADSTTGREAIVGPTVIKAAESTTGHEAKAFELKRETKSHSSALLEEVIDIDAGDSENLYLVHEYASDIYSYLLDLECKMSVRKAHLSAQSEITPKMRAVLMDWINEVHLQFHLVMETYHLTIAIIDRYLQKTHDVQRKHLQLVGIGALFLASKYEDLYPPNIADFVYISDNAYTREEILAIEMKIIKTLDFNMGSPLSIQFLRRFSKAADTTGLVHTLAKYMLELVSIEYALAHHPPSEVAAASLFLSLKLFNQDPSLSDDRIWSRTLEFYSTYTAESLKSLVKRIAILVKKAPTATLKAVYNKYTLSKYEKIALRPELNATALDKIINE